MEQVLNKAKEGGYKSPNLIGTEMGYYANVVLDPKFFQALGKACGWGNMEVSFGNWDEPIKMSTESVIGWKHIALKFHEINLTEGWDKAVEYLSTLIKE